MIRRKYLLTTSDIRNGQVISNYIKASVRPRDIPISRSKKRKEGQEK
jgi:hypothetical protein